MIVHLTTGAVFSNRKQAKEAMGHANYNHAIRNNEFSRHDEEDPA